MRRIILQPLPFLYLSVTSQPFPLLCAHTISYWWHYHAHASPPYLYTCPPEPDEFTLAITEWVTAPLLHPSLMGNKNEMHFSGNSD